MNDGDELTEAYRLCFCVIRNKRRRIVGDDAAADELAQDVFAQLWAKRWAL